jgi:potassium/hydrogen antiporter
VASGLGAVWLLNRIDMPGGLHPLFVVAGAVFIYALTSILGGSGLLAAYLAGLVLANRPVRAYPSIVAFHDAATWLAQIGMFLVLGLLVTPSTLIDYAVPGLAVAGFLILVARPAAVWLCLSPFGFSRNEKLYFSWVGLRGAVSVFLAAIPTLAGVPQAEVYFNMAFFVVLVSLMVQGWTVNSSARRLGLALRRTAPAVTRIELDIPGQVGQEMVGYPVSPESMVLGLTHLPSAGRGSSWWCAATRCSARGSRRPARRRLCLFPHPAGPHSAHGPAVRRNRDLARRMSPLFGELSIKGEAALADVAELYDLEVPPKTGTSRWRSFFEAYISAAGRSPAIGCRSAAPRLVARSVEDGRVVRAGLQLEELLDTLVASALAQPAFGPTSQALQRWLDRCPRAGCGLSPGAFKLPAPTCGFMGGGMDQMERTRPMQTTQVAEFARQLLDAHGDRAEKVQDAETSGDDQLPENWRRVRAAIHELRPPHAS